MSHQYSAHRIGTSDCGSGEIIRCSVDMRTCKLIFYQFSIEYKKCSMKEREKKKDGIPVSRGQVERNKKGRKGPSISKKEQQAFYIIHTLAARLHVKLSDRGEAHNEWWPLH